MSTAAIIIGSLITLGVAVGAASIPVIIHLLNRRRFRIVNWGAMRFLLAAHRKNARRMRLEQLILLALRVAIVVLLVLAMASASMWAKELWGRCAEWFRGNGFSSSFARAATSNRRTYKILVIDGSLSMATRVGDQSCFDKALLLAQQIVESSPESGYSVILMTSPAQTIVTGPADDAGRVEAEIRKLQLPHGNADLAGTLVAIEGLLHQPLGRYEQKEVYFLTDLQKSTWIGQQPGGLAGTIQNIHRHARTIIVDVGRDGIANLAITNLALGTPLASTTSETPISVTLRKYGPETREQVRVNLYIGKARATAADAPFELSLVQQKVVKLTGEQIQVSFAHHFSAPGDYVVQVRIDPDALELDDVRSAVITVRKEVPVLLVNGKPDKVLERQATEFLFDALNPYHEGLVPGDVPARPKKVTVAQFADANLYDLTPYDCVFLCDVPRLSQPEISRLETHLQRGGGLVISLGDQVDLRAYNDLLYKGGNGILPARLIARQEAPEGCYFRFREADEKAFHQPPLLAFTEAEPKVRDNLLKAQFHKYIRAETNQPGLPRKVLNFFPETSFPGRSLPANVPTTDPALIEWLPPLPKKRDEPKPTDRERSPPIEARYRGRVILFTSTLNLDWTAWPPAPSYPALMQELLRHAITGRLREQTFTVGDTIEEVLPTTSSTQQVSLTLPGRAEPETFQTQIQGDATVLHWAETSTSGVYRATIGDRSQEHFFAVNVPTADDTQQASESDLTRTNEAEIRDAYQWEFQLVTDPQQARHQPTKSADTEDTRLALSGEQNGEHWGSTIAAWLLLLMFLGILAEVVLAWLFGHFSDVGGTLDARPARGVLLPILTLAGAGLLFLTVAAVLIHARWTGDFLGFLPDGVRRSLETGSYVPDLMCRTFDACDPGMFPKGFRHFVALAPDLPPLDVSESRVWRLDVSPELAGVLANPWFIGLTALASAALLIVVHQLEGRTASILYKLLLSGVLFCFVLLALDVLLPRLQVTFERQSWPDLAIILDDSGSMGTIDHYHDPKVQAVADELAHRTSLTKAQRLQLAQAILTDEKNDWLRTLWTEKRFKIHVYHCSKRSAHLTDVTSKEQIDPAVAAVKELQVEAGNDSSQLGSAVRQVLNESRGSSLAGIIMFTDGVTTEGEDLVKVSSYARQRSVPIYFVGIGDADVARDLALHDLQVEDSVYVNDRLVFEARLSGTGYPDLTVPVRLREKGKDKILAEQRVKVDPDGKPVKVRLVFSPTEAGDKVYVLDVPAQPDEARTDNNALERNIFVQEIKLIKVLYVENSGDWNFRDIKTLLERESSLHKGNKTIDLKVLLTGADDQWPSTAKNAVSVFPDKAELNLYDVVILGDVDPRHPKLGEKHLHDLADFVRERGGGLLMMAGDQYAPYSYKRTPLQDILPIDITDERPHVDLVRPRTVGYRPELTPLGRMHPIFRFDPDEKTNDEIWNRLKEMYWWSEGYRAKPAAEILAVHPGVRQSDAQDKSRAEQHPLVLQHFVGAGRCMFIGFNETWRWRWREDEQRFNQFWIQTVRHLARSRSGRIDIRLDRQTNYRRGEPMRITVRFPDEAPAPGAEAEVKVVVERKPPRPAGRKDEQPADAQAAEVQTLTLARLEGSRATYETLLTRTPEGEYRIWLSAPAVAGQKPQVQCRVLAPPGEMEQLQMNRPDMERVAQETGGSFHTLATADELLAKLPTGESITRNAQVRTYAVNIEGSVWYAWRNWPVFLVAIWLLTMYWVLRKRKHLL